MALPILPHRDFCPSDHPSYKLLGMPVAVCCLKSPTSQPCLVNLLLQLEGHFTSGVLQQSGVITTSSAQDLTTTPLSNRLSHGSMEHGPLRFRSPHYLWGLLMKRSQSWDMNNIFTQSSARCSQQTLTICLIHPGLSGFLPSHQIQLTTISDQLTTLLLYLLECPVQISHRSNEMTTKSIIDCRPRMSWF